MPADQPEPAPVDGEDNFPGLPPEPMQPWTPTAENPGLEPDPQARVWQRHTDGAKRTRAADRAVRAAILAEQHGEYDENGQFRPSTWGAV